MKTNPGIQLQIWMLLFEDGGRWTPEDIVEHFIAEFPTINRQHAKVLMHNMVTRSKTLRRDKDASGRVRFFVAPECFVPAGVGLERLMAGGVIEIKRTPVNSVFSLGAAA